jgi:hypothetical protein
MMLAEVQKARTMVEIAHIAYENYRFSYRSALNKYAEEANKESAEFREEFSTEWILRGRGIIRALAQAENKVKELLADAERGGIVVLDEDDNRESSPSYNDEDIVQYFIENLDREGITKWLSKVPNNAGIGPPPETDTEDL